MNDFFRAVLPAEGQYRLVNLNGKYPEVRWAGSLAELDVLAGQFAGHERIYFSTASFNDRSDGTARNVRLNKALRLDIDAGEAKWAKHKGEGVYKTQMAALAAFVQFTRDTALKATYVVSSGQGLHIYYALPSGIEAKPWLALAARLSTVCQQRGLMVDPTVTEDVVRLLRVPGSKHESGTDVKVLAGTGEALTWDKLEALLPKPLEVDPALLALNDEVLSPPAERSYPPTSALRIVPECGALRSVAEAEGDVPEPLWRAMIGIVKHCVEGADLAHQWSRGSPSYSERETQLKFDRWQAGPTTCEEFAKHSPACATCPHWGKIKSPIQLGALPDVAQAALPVALQTTLIEPPPPAPVGDPWDGMLPASTKVERDGTHARLLYGLKQMKRDDSGNAVTERVWVPLSKSLFWFSQWGQATTSYDTAQVILCLWTGKHTRTFEMDQTCLASPAKLLEFLAGKAIHASNHPLAIKALYTYAKEQLMFIQQEHMNLRVTDRFGMRILEGSDEVVAVHGRYTIHGDGTIRDTLLGPTLRPNAGDYTLPLPPAMDTNEVWDPIVWDTHLIPAARKHVKFLNDNYGSEGMRDYQLAIALALASPIMAFTTGLYNGGDLPDACSLSVSLYSRDGGFGKTTACQAAMMAYGSPARLTRSQGNDATTDLARFARLSLCGTMPNVMDEMGGLTAKKMHSLVSLMANGSGRARLASDGSLKASTPWALINLMTTNKSLQEMLQFADNSDAVQRRLLEIDVGHMTMPDVVARERFMLEFGDVAANCSGALGAVLERELCKLGAVELRNRAVKMVNAADKMMAVTAADRFMYRALGAVLLSYTLLHPLGLAPFDLRAIVDQFKSAFTHSLESIAASAAANNPLEQLNRALHDLIPFTVVTDGMADARTKAIDRVLNAHVPDNIQVRHVKSRGTSYVVVDALKNWAQENEVSEWELASVARKEGVMLAASNGAKLRRDARICITNGLPASTNARVRCYVINTRRLGELLNSSLPDEYDATGEESNVVQLPVAKPPVPPSQVPAVPADPATAT